MTLVGGGVFPKEQSARGESAFNPQVADWIREHVAEFHPEQNYIVTRAGRKISYDFLVVGLGIEALRQLGDVSAKELALQR